MLLLRSEDLASTGYPGKESICRCMNRNQTCGDENIVSERQRTHTFANPPAVPDASDASFPEAALRLSQHDVTSQPYVSSDVQNLSGEFLSSSNRSTTCKTLSHTVSMLSRVVR